MINPWFVCHEHTTETTEGKPNTLREWPARRTYSVSMMFHPKEYAQIGSLIIHRFDEEVNSECMTKGYPKPPADTQKTIIGLRENDGPDKDQKAFVECETFDERALFVQIYTTWTS